MPELSILYEQDYYLWLQEISKLLEKKDLPGLDFTHLIEEVQGLGNEQRNKVDSYLRQLLIHLLLHQYWHQEKRYCAKGWKNEIDNFRFELELLFRSQTLYRYFLDEIEVIYPKARRQAINQSELPPATLPITCPYSPQELLNPDFYPE